MLRMLPIIAVLGFFIACAITLVVIFQRYYGLWIKSYMSHAGVTYFEIVGMTFRKVDSKLVVNSRIKAVQAGLAKAQMPTVAGLEAHYLAGGDVDKVVTALIAADRNGINLSWEDATALDLSGKDVWAAAQGKTIQNTLADAETDIPSLGTVLIEGKPVDAISAGEPIRRGQRVRVVDVVDTIAIVRPE